MLQSLHIENVAVIEKAEITFSTGLTALTGETGAGKSIVIDAINALLGERITRDVVRNGADKAYIAGVFDCLPPEVVTRLEELELPPDEDGTLLVQRSLTADGKGSCRVGGRPATVATLREIGRMLVNIHGQHENQALLQAERHVEYLDRLGGLEAEKSAYLDAYRRYCRIQRTIKASTLDEQEKQRRIEELQSSIAVIDEARVQPGELAELLSRRELARHSEKVVGCLQLVRQAMNDQDIGEGRGVLTRLTDSVNALQTAGQVSDNLLKLAQRLQSCLYDVQAVAEEAEEAENALQFDESALNALEDRVALIQRLLRRYAVADESELLAHREEMQTQLNALESAEEQLEDLQRQAAEAREQTITAAGVLTAARKQAAAKFEQDVCHQLAFMDMPHVRLEVAMDPAPLNAVGGERVEFRISSNPGEPAKSITRTASGGELSRIMLALKSVLAEVDDIETLVFDEVDAGISGRAAAKVGSLLRQIAECRQVLCVTHLAQIAAYGHSHLLVSKSVADGRTYTRVEDLDEEARCKELARIMGGEVTDITVSAATEMRKRAEE